MILLAATFFCAVAAGSSVPPARSVPLPEELAGVARDALAAESAAGLEDAHEWLFQAARGGEHATPSEEAARGFVPDPGLFVTAWHAFGRGLAEGGADGWNTRAFEELDRSSEKAGWPARHHSQGYTETRRFAYRVLTGEEADRLQRERGGAR